MNYTHTEAFSNSNSNNHDAHSIAISSIINEQPYINNNKSHEQHTDNKVNFFLSSTDNNYNTNEVINIEKNK